MAKFVIDFNKRNSKLWLDDERYNELVIRNCIGMYDETLKIDGIVLLKDVLKSLGFDIKKIDVNTLIRYWTDVEHGVDITYIKKGNCVYTLVFDTDN